MKLSIRNVGKLKEADVEINGITVIAGENNTGKSTIGKVLFSIFQSLYKLDDQIIREKRNEMKAFRNKIRKFFGIKIKQ